MALTSYRELRVWQQAVELVVACYRLTGNLPKSETYGLASQIRRAAVSIPANVAEGHGRDHLGDYLHHLSIAHGSLLELETHLIIANKLGYLEVAELQTMLGTTDEIGRMLTNLRKSLRKRETNVRGAPAT